MTRTPIQNNISEQDLIDLGFVRNEDWDNGEYYYYYTYDLSKEDNTFCLITACNTDDYWYVELFNFYTMRFNTIEDVKLFINLVERNAFTKPTR